MRGVVQPPSLAPRSQRRWTARRRCVRSAGMALSAAAARCWASSASAAFGAASSGRCSLAAPAP